MENFSFGMVDCLCTWQSWGSHCYIVSLLYSICRNQRKLLIIGKREL